MIRNGIHHDDLAQVPVQVGQIFDDFALVRPGRFAEQLVWNECPKWIQFFGNWCSVLKSAMPPVRTYDAGLDCKQDNLVELTQVCQEIVGSRTLCSAPSGRSLNISLAQSRSA
jgi:hypothetical protein